MDEQLSFDIAQPIICRCCGQAVEGAKFLTDEAQGLFYSSDEAVHLTRQEFKIAKLLLDRYPNVVSKDGVYMQAICDGKSEADWPEIKIVDVMICKIRPKLAKVGLLVETVWGKGYKLTHGNEMSAAEVKESGIRNRAPGAANYWSAEREKQLVDLMARKNSATACATLMRLPYVTIARHFKRLRDTHFAKTQVNQ